MQGRVERSAQEAHRPHPAHQGQHLDANLLGISQRIAREPGVPERDETPAQSCQEVYGEIKDERHKVATYGITTIYQFIIKRGTLVF